MYCSATIVSVSVSVSVSAVEVDIETRHVERSGLFDGRSVSLPIEEQFDVSFATALTVDGDERLVTDSKFTVAR